MAPAFWCWPAEQRDSRANGRRSALRARARDVFLYASMLLRRRVWQSDLRPMADHRAARRIAPPSSAVGQFEQILAAQPCYLVPDWLINDAIVDPDLDRFFDSPEVVARAD